jgi:dTDP-4-dehydrorhamnose 3,5-epimerase
MNMKSIKKEKNSIKDLLVIEPEVFYDFRGENCETFNVNNYKKLILEEIGVKLNFVVDSFSFSKKHTLRGFHGDTKTWKIVQCLKGEIYFVVIDLRQDSPTYNYHKIYNLNDKNRLQVLIPSGCVNAHLCMSDECIFNYKLSESYTEQCNQISIKWNDPKYDIYWPVKTPILSERDS